MGRAAAARRRRRRTAPSVTNQSSRPPPPHCPSRRGGATPGPARDGRRRPAFVVVRASRRRLQGPCSARNSRNRSSALLASSLLTIAPEQQCPLTESWLLRWTSTRGQAAATETAAIDASRRLAGCHFAYRVVRPIRRTSVVHHMGNQRTSNATLEGRQRWIPLHPPPFPALSCLRESLRNRLDKAEVAGSSPASPTSYLWLASDTRRCPHAERPLFGSGRGSARAARGAELPGGGDDRKGCRVDHAAIVRTIFEQSEYQCMPNRPSLLAARHTQVRTPRLGSARREAPADAMAGSH
jgi:hypothetical protein